MGARYLLGLGLVGAAGLLIASLLGPAYRAAAMYGVLIGMVVQAPLGWWTIRSIGTPRFQLAWVTGMLVRLTVLAIAALVLAPEYAWNTAATLVSLVATLLVLLMVEALTAAGLRSETRSR